MHVLLGLGAGQAASLFWEATRFWEDYFAFPMETSRQDNCGPKIVPTETHVVRRHVATSLPGKRARKVATRHLGHLRGLAGGALLTHAQCLDGGRMVLHLFYPRCCRCRPHIRIENHVGRQVSKKQTIQQTHMTEHNFEQLCVAPCASASMLHSVG